jgi:hypothetical protein
MSTNHFVDQITMDCLINKEQYNKYLQTKTNQTICRKDRKFYRKRIVDLTRDLLCKPSVHEKEILPDVKSAFEHYIKTSIEYFKSLDNNDIIQNEYKELNTAQLDEFLDGTSNNNMHENNSESLEDSNKLLMRSIHSEKAASLDGFVKRIITKPVVKPIIPKKKEINLTDPALKIKGVVKKSQKDKMLSNNKKDFVDNNKNTKDTEDTTKNSIDL